MSVMSVGKKPRALVRPLRAGNSQTGVRGGQFRPGEPGLAGRPSGKAARSRRVAAAAAG